MARVEVHKEVPKQLNEGVWNLCFQKVTYYYNNGDKQDGYRFIWRRPDGSLQAARGQARIESYEQMHELIDLAKKEGFFEEKPRVIIDNDVNGNKKCSDFGNSECSSFGIKTTVFLASVVQ